MHKEKEANKQIKKRIKELQREFQQCQQARTAINNRVIEIQGAVAELEMLCGSHKSKKEKTITNK